MDKKRNREDILTEIREYLVFIPDGARMMWNSSELGLLMFRDLSDDEVVSYDKIGLGIPSKILSPLLSLEELRKIDLRDVCFVNVDIRGNDLSYTNAVINIDNIYAKCIDNTNLDGVKVVNNRRKVRKR